MVGKAEDGAMLKSFTGFVVLRLDNAWRRTAEGDKEQARSEFARAISGRSTARAYLYNITGLKAGADLLLLINATSPEGIQETVSGLLSTRLGSHLSISHSFFGIAKSSTFPENAQDGTVLKERRAYLVFYPFSKSVDWYLLSKEERAELMAEHIRIGKSFKSVSQSLIYSFGLDDQDFVVAYETDSLADFQEAVIKLREAKVRKYTTKETPVFVCVYRPLDEALRRLG